MAHIHLPDGSFTLPWILFWWACALAVLGAALILARRRGPAGRDIAVAAFLTAASFAVFQVEVPVFGGVHLNLTPLVGILAGPILGGLVVFVTNIFLAAIGHGGWGLIGANVLVNATEVAAAWLVFRALKRATSSLSIRAGIAAFGALFAGNLVMVAVILVSGVQGALQGSTQLLAGLLLLVAVNLGGAVIEAVLTGLMVGYIGRVKPGLLEGTP